MQMIMAKASEFVFNQLFLLAGLHGLNDPAYLIYLIKLLKLGSLIDERHADAASKPHLNPSSHLSGD